MAHVSRLPAIYFEKLLETSPDIVVAVDRHGVIIFYNDGARSTLSYAPEEVLGEHVTRLYPDLDEARKVMTAMREGFGDAPAGQVRNFETTFVAKDGSAIPVAISGSVIRTESDETLGSIGFAKDLREIRRHDQLATLGELAISLAHEINNPLEVIVNNLNLLTKHIARVSSDEDFVVESERVDSTREAVARIQDILAKVGETSRADRYVTRDYLPGTPMTDLDAARARNTSLDPALVGIRILVVDDDLGVCHSLRDLLTQEGLEVLVAGDGREALERLETTSVDLVLSDVVMPDVDGYQLFRAVRERHPDIPVVLMTAFHFDKDHVIKRSSMEGVEGVVFKKPIDPAKLRELIKRHARRPSR